MLENLVLVISPMALFSSLSGKLGGRIRKPLNNDHKWGHSIYAWPSTQDWQVNILVHSTLVVTNLSTETGVFDTPWANPTKLSTPSTVFSVAYYSGLHCALTFSYRSHFFHQKRGQIGWLGTMKHQHLNLVKINLIYIKNEVV